MHAQVPGRGQAGGRDQQVNALIYSDAFWAVISLGSYLLLAVAIVADLCRTKPRRIS